MKFSFLIVGLGKPPSICGISISCISEIERNVLTEFFVEVPNIPLDMRAHIENKHCSIDINCKCTIF